MHENELEKEKYIPQYGPHFPSCVNIDASVLIPLPPPNYFESLQPQQPPIWSAGVKAGEKVGVELLAPPPHPRATAEDRVLPDICHIGAKASRLGRKLVSRKSLIGFLVGRGGVWWSPGPTVPSLGAPSLQPWDPAPAQKPPVSAPDPSQRRLSVAPNHLSQELCC